MTGIDGRAVYEPYEAIFWMNDIQMFAARTETAVIHPPDERYGDLCLRLFRTRLEQEKERPKDERGIPLYPRMQPRFFGVSP